MFTVLPFGNVAVTRTVTDGVGTTREVMADLLLEYIEAQGTISPVLDGRIDDLAS